MRDAKMHRGTDVSRDVAAHTVDDAIGRAALRKAGLRLLPVLAVGYGMAYMDRINISFAALR